MENKKIVTWVIISLLILIAALVIYKIVTVNKDNAENNQQVGQRLDAPKGEYVEGFPKDVVRENETNEESYAIKYDGADQYTTNLTSDKSAEVVAKGYSDYFTAQKFSGVRVQKESDQLTTVFAASPDALYSVIIQKPDPSDKTYVTINVLKR